MDSSRAKALPQSYTRKVSRISQFSIKKFNFFLCHTPERSNPSAKQPQNNPKPQKKKAPRREPPQPKQRNQYIFLSLSEASRAISVFTGSLTLLMKIMAAMTYGL